MEERNIEYLSEIQLDSLKGFGDKRYSQLKRNNLKSVLDLLRFFPRGFWDRSSIKSISDVNQHDSESEITVFGKIDKVSVFTTKTRLRITTLNIKDESGGLKAKWFGPQYIETRFKEGDSVALSGRPEVKKTGSVEFKNPTIEKFEEISELNETGALIPKYPKIEGVSTSIIRKSIKNSLSVLETEKDNFIPGFQDILPQTILNKYNLVNRLWSFKNIHFPAQIEDYYKAKERLVLDEFIYLRSIFSYLKSKQKELDSGLSYSFSEEDISYMKELLPFELTNSQKKVLKEILEDLKNSFPMKRLLQGDVGSGKTVVAAIAIYAVVKSGYQVTLMAPTEVLAEQHLKTLENFLYQLDVDINFLTSSIKNRDHILEKIDNGTPGLYIGTHALIQDKIKFKNLGLVIIDEQQRFGVEQRKKLAINSEFNPDQLVMTATPIPRTTALSIYGDLDISSINEMPPGRKKIVSHLFNGLKEDDKKISNIVMNHLNDKSQVFVVCPFIEESENLDIKAAENVFEDYKNMYSEFNVEIMHGRMTSEEKDKIMTKMSSGEIDILVSTVVIEVGIDIPNATLIVIESSERFGLNQLHQLRGRVGRGTKQSECIFHITNKKTLESISDDGKKRLESIVKIDDGFKLSEIDLEIRGEGKVTGTHQSGKSDLKLANLRYDIELLLKSKEIFEDLKNDKDADQIFTEAKLLFPNYFKVDSST